jgi:hypothetical protein
MRQKSAMNVTWIKLTTGDWCPFQTVDLSNVATQGVYMIWYKGNPGRVAYVGQGDVKARITQRRRDARILAYTGFGLLVTWAAVPAHQRDGVERHLADAWNPLAGDQHPDVLPIAVNSPWG